MYMSMMFLYGRGVHSMKFINTHGLKMTGLKYACGLTKRLQGSYDPRYYQLSYNVRTGEVIMCEHYDFGHGSRSIYYDDDIKTIAYLHWPHTMQELADMIAMGVL